MTSLGRCGAVCAGLPPAPRSARRLTGCPRLLCWLRRGLCWPAACASEPTPLDGLPRPLRRLLCWYCAGLPPAPRSVLPLQLTGCRGTAHPQNEGLRLAAVRGLRLMPRNLRGCSCCPGTARTLIQISHTFFRRRDANNAQAPKQSPAKPGEKAPQSKVQITRQTNPPATRPKHRPDKAASLCTSRTISNLTRGSVARAAPLAPRVA